MMDLSLTEQPLDLPADNIYFIAIIINPECKVINSPGAMANNVSVA